MKCCKRVLSLIFLVFTICPATLADEAGGKPLKSVSGANFLVSAPSDDLARAVLNRAEQLRREISREWLGRELPPSVGHTVIDVFTSGTEFSGLTSPSSDLKRPTFMMWLTASGQEAVGPLLAHEVTHVVLLTRYPGRVAPWVDEGIACRYDDVESKQIRDDVIAWFSETGNWPSLADILTTDKISRWDRASFAVSSSLVEFLLTRGDNARLLAFAVEGRDRGWDTALRAHYNIAGVPALEKAWRSWAAEKHSSVIGG